MEPKKSRSIGLIIRRFFATFLFFSTVMGIITDIETNAPRDETLGGAFVSFIIIYLLARSPRKNRPNSDVDIETTEIEVLEDEVDLEELLEEYDESFENVEPEEETISRNEKMNKRNPVRDKQSILSRIFQGKTDRY